MAMMTVSSALNHVKSESDTWLAAVAEHLSLEDRRDAYIALRAALHALRDRLPPEQAMHLGSQLPIAIRSVYFDGLHLSPPARGDRCVQDFCGHIGEQLPPNFPLDAKNIAKGVFDVLLKQLDQEEVANLFAALPAPLQALWASTARRSAPVGSSVTHPHPGNASTVLGQL
jgi:uncharacterized protein (DUF2267 family)